MMATIQQLHFLRPEYLWLLPLIVTAFIALYLLRSKSSQWYDVIDPSLIEHLLDNTANQQANRRTSLPLISAALACCIAIIALAGPSWEKLPSVTEQKNDAMIIIADLTLSMHATDIKPSRLIRTRYKLLELLKQRKAGQTALIAYSGDAHIVSPLTDDASTIAALIPSLSPEIMPSIGSNAIAAFNQATQLLKNSGISQAKIVWFTDEALPSDLTAINKILNNANKQLIIIGVGSKAGGPVPLPSGKFVKDTSGRIVNAPLSRDRLKNIAAYTGGVYLDLQSDNSDIDIILSESLFDPLSSTENTEKSDTKNSNISDTWQDRGGYTALLLLPFALLAFRRGWMLSLVLAFNISSINYVEAKNDNEAASESNNFKWLDLWQTPDQQAYALARQQQHSQAAKKFENPNWKGVAEYQAGDYQPALETLSGLAAKNNSDTAHYNHGHALARNNQLDDAIAAYDKALAINPNMENAKQAKAIIEALQKQQEQQQEQQQEGEENNQQQQGDQQDKQQEGSEQSSDKNNPSSQNSESESNSENDSEGSTEKNNDSSNELLDRQAEQNNSENEEQQAQQNIEQEGNSEKTATERQEAERDADNKSETEHNTTDIKLSEQQLNAEQQAELQQWLKKIPDDPGGLLRRKFQYERNVRERQGKVIDDREQGQLW